jgi:F-type H+-transporting ATPase subunit b
MGVQRSIIVGAAVMASLVGTALPAYAEGSMPQFDFRNPLLVAQVVWGAIIFVAMYVAFTRIGLPQVASVLAAREQTIGGDLEQARIAKDKADRAVAELNEARRVAYAEAQTALSAATQKAKEAAAAKAEEVNAKLDRQLADSEKQIAAARAGAMSALREAAFDTTDLLVARLAGRPADAQAVRAAVADALAARGLTA